MTLVAPAPSLGLLNEVDRRRQDVSRGLNSASRAELGQYFTPAATARLMASLAVAESDCVRLLDPGAGIGILTAAWVAEMCSRPVRPREVVLTAFELDASLIEELTRTLAECQLACEQVGVKCRVDIRNRDFVEDGVEALDRGLWPAELPPYNLAILNPPYKKFRSSSRARYLLRRLGVETSNLYTAFLSLVVRLLSERGELVAITPRSFCNGPYFRPFRRDLLKSVNITQLHVFDSRDHAFREDDVLQENIILHAIKGVPQQETVTISQSHSPEDSAVLSRIVGFDRVVQPTDSELFIHLVADQAGHSIADSMRALPNTLTEIGIGVSTGRVVDFRAKEWLRANPEPGTVALIYPTHFADGFVQWPKLGGKKPNAIVHHEQSAPLLVVSGTYVLVKRFSSKEERRRVVAAVFDPERVGGEVVGFENHLNYFHAHGSPMPRTLALGLAAFLNSTQLDLYFRQFNGHTQVNATDLRTLRYPARAALEALGRLAISERCDQASLDAAVADVLAGARP